MTAPFIHPNTPARLKTAFKRAGYNFRELARLRGVNAYYVHRLITKGIEPTNPANRIALFLPRKPRAIKLQTSRQPLPDHIKWWRRLDKTARNRILERLYHHAQTINSRPAP